jgi:hypothetical protein
MGRKARGLEREVRRRALFPFVKRAKTLPLIRFMGIVHCV